MAGKLGFSSTSPEARPHSALAAAREVVQLRSCFRQEMVLFLLRWTNPSRDGMDAEKDMSIFVRS